MTELVYTAPDASHWHRDKRCAEREGRPALRMSRKAAESLGADKCPDCVGDGEGR